MTTYEINKINLIEAANRLAQAIKASEKLEDKSVLTHKGKTLYHINRERVNMVKMTVNY
jgi:hypothetical protein